MSFVASLLPCARESSRRRGGCAFGDRRGLSREGRATYAPKADGVSGVL
jgi:hypothetical protein